MVLEHPAMPGFSVLTGLNKSRIRLITRQFISSGKTYSQRNPGLVTQALRSFLIIVVHMVCMDVVAQFTIRSLQSCNSKGIVKHRGIIKDCRGRNIMINMSLCHNTNTQSDSPSCYNLPSKEQVRYLPKHALVGVWSLGRHR